MKISLFLIALLFVFKTNAQSYTITRGLPVAEIATPSTGVTTITTLTDDNYSAAQNIGFSFTFYGNTYSSFYVGSNGVLSFGTAKSGSYGSVLPNSGNYNSITFAGGDLDCSTTPSPSGLINSFTTGVSPNRILVLNFKNIRTFSSLANFSNVQVQLYEGSNKIELHVTNVQSNPGSKNRCIGICDVGTNFTSDTNLNGISSLNVVNEMLRFNLVPSCTNTLTLTSSAPNICTGSNVVLTANASTPSGLLYEWYKNGALINGATSSTLNLSNKDDFGNYFIKIKDPVSGCDKATASQFIGSTAVSASFSDVVCSGSTLNLIGNSNFAGSGVVYSWSRPNGFTSSSNTSSVIMNTTTQGLYTFSATLAGCGTGSYARQIIITTPVFSASSDLGDNPMCESTFGFDLIVNINNNPDRNAPIPSPTTATYAWTGPDGFTSTARNPTVSPRTIAKSGVYTVTITLAGGCTEVITKKVGVKIVSTPDPQIDYYSLTNTACASDSIQLFMSNSFIPSQTIINYLWTLPDGTTSTLSRLKSKIGEGGNYSLTTTFSGGCVGTTTRNLTLYPKVIPDAVTYPVQSTCVGKNHTFNINYSPSGYTYNWTGPNGFTATGPSPTINNVSLANAGNYSVIISAANCPNTNTVTVPLTVDATCPTVSCSANINISYATNIGYKCQGSTIFLVASISNKVPGITYNWTGPNGFTANSSQVVLNNLQANNFGLYTCIVNVPFGLCAGTKTLTFDLTQTLNNDIKINPITNLTICEGESARFDVFSNQSRFEYVEVTGPNGFKTYSKPVRYESPIGRIFTSERFYNFISSNIPTTLAGTYTINATLKPTCPSNSNEVIESTASYTVAVTPRPVKPIIAALPANILVGQTSTLSSSSACSGTLQWQFNLGAGTTKIVNPTTTKSYWATCNNSLGCSSLGSNIVTVIVGTPCSTMLSLSNPADNISSGTVTKQANATTGTIAATNYITGSANVTYRAGKSITLDAGFKADNGTVFKTEFGGCN